MIFDSVCSEIGHPIPKYVLINLILFMVCAFLEDFLEVYTAVTMFVGTYKAKLNKLITNPGQENMIIISVLFKFKTFNFNYRFDKRKF